MGDLVGICRELKKSVKTLISRVVVDGVTITLASPILLWKTKQTFREKHQIDRLFLRKLLEDRGEWPVV